MEGQKSKLAKLLVLYIFFAAGAIWHIVPDTRALMLTITPYLLFGLNLGIIWLVLRRHKRPRQFLAWVIFAYLFTFIAEAVGVQTGLVFGEYIYGNVLGPVLYGAPLLIGLNWVMVTLGAAQIVDRLADKVKSIRNFAHPRLAKAIIISLVTALVATLFDVIMEPVAIDLGYWAWGGGVVPLQNYIAWFVISFTIILPVLYLRLMPKNRLLSHYFLSQLLFFLLLLLPVLFLA